MTGTKKLTGQQAGIMIFSGRLWIQSQCVFSLTRFVVYSLILSEPEPGEGWPEPELRLFLDFCELDETTHKHYKPSDRDHCLHSSQTTVD